MSGTGAECLCGEGWAVCLRVSGSSEGRGAGSDSRPRQVLLDSLTQQDSLALLLLLWAGY